MNLTKTQIASSHTITYLNSTLSASESLATDAPCLQSCTVILDFDQFQWWTSIFTQVAATVFIAAGNPNETFISSVPVASQKQFSSSLDATSSSLDDLFGPSGSVSPTNATTWRWPDDSEVTLYVGGASLIEFVI